VIGAAIIRAACACAAVAVLLPGQALAGGGTFASSDPALDQIWSASVATAADMVSAPVDLDPRGCQISLPKIVLDGLVRDRCPYVGDLAVTGKTLLLSQDDVSALRATINWFAANQADDGAIPASPFRNGSLQLVDYNAYWIEALYDYTLYTGDLSLLRDDWASLVRLVDELYPAHVANGVLVNWLGNSDYAYIPRGGARVAYYDAQYVRALRLASALAGWNGDAGRASRWSARADDSAAAFGGAFWDRVAGAFRDTTADSDVHAEDGTAFALLAGLATTAQATSVLTYIDRTMRKSYGNAMADVAGWHGPNWGDGDNDRVYPFIGYFEVAARYAVGADASAVELIRREWGFMATRKPGTMWETISPGGFGTVDGNPSWDHGWSSGAAPALTTWVLGVQPTSPGFATFTVTPHPSGLTSARGIVPTPRGPILVSWQASGGRVSVQVDAPAGTVWANRPAAATAPAKTTTPVAPKTAAPAVAARPIPVRLAVRRVAAVSPWPPSPKVANPDLGFRANG
jgi:hypothetical protein